MNGKINSQGIKYMDTWQDIGGSICPIDLSHQSCKDVASGEYCRAEMLNVRIDVGNNKENRHSHHQVEDQLEIFLLFLLRNRKYTTVIITYGNHKRYGIIKISQNGIISSKTVCTTW